ncbi:L-lactate dehydrogenase [Paenibacillus pectinilyticus]|uniref:L-lactate dehydrogenase n=1 Tax=Paenibacillus pectinilyticus TaxID=512399 RepID=A0A1C0ZZ19_9BACL|nr:L-lactate dehydrogenase [Paenibacillus pectinilyticus]OCT13384.1 L-lactate dehydrogenase [Paenibacillus pectinilyticus]
MVWKPRKVAIVGMGVVGSSCAYALINQSVCEELMLINRTSELAMAQALDLSHCMDFTQSWTKVFAGSYDQCGDVDVIILTPGAPMNKGQNRLELMESSIDIMNEIVPLIMQSGFNGIFLVATNPVDIITYTVWRLSGLPRNRVVGTGTSIDSSRLKKILSEIFPVEPKSVHGYVLGEHGESQFVAWSHVTIGGKPLTQIISQYPQRFGLVELDQLAERTKLAGYEIFNIKGATCYGIGSALAFITRSILNDDHKIIAVSAILDGEYGEREVCVGVPAIISKDGVKEVVELHLHASEQENFHYSCDLIREHLYQASLLGAN